MARDRRKVWSLFTGAYGLDLGFEAAGFDTEVAFELDPFCCETLRENRPGLDVECADLKEVSFTSESTSPFAVIGGPPCQSFSTGGKRLALGDPRGNLVLHFFRIVSELQPEFFVFENVASLLTAALSHRPIKSRPGKHWNLKKYSLGSSIHSDGAPPMQKEELSGSAFDSLLPIIRELGYTISFGVLDSAEHGSPQKRMRFVIVGAKCPENAVLPLASHGPGEGLKPVNTVRGAIGDLEDDPGPGSQFTPQVRSVFRRVPMGGNWRDLPDPIARQAMGKSFFAGGGKTGFFRRLSYDQPAPTITGRANRKGSSLCHPTQDRPLSVSECARLQGFPDDWTFTGSISRQYQQIGNAVPVELGKAIGLAILKKTNYISGGDIKIQKDIALETLRRSARNRRRKVSA